MSSLAGYLMVREAWFCLVLVARDDHWIFLPEYFYCCCLRFLTHTLNTVLVLNDIMYSTRTPESTLLR